MRALPVSCSRRSRFLADRPRRALPSALAACDNHAPRRDPAASTPAVVTPTALGSGSRIRDIMDPTLPTHPASGASVSITGATYLVVDTFDETHDGKSKGTVYLEDLPASTPLAYSGASLYAPTYLPANLEPAPGDVLDLVGTYTENKSIGSAIFSSGTALIQIDKPVVKPRFEYQLPAALVIQASDLDNYAKGLQWESMLVTIQNVTFPDSITDSSGRDTVHVTSDTSPATGPRSTTSSSTSSGGTRASPRRRSSPARSSSRSPGS